MTKLIIYDTVLTAREVEVPEVCPHCSGYLGKENAAKDTSLVAWDLNDRGFFSSVNPEVQVNGARVPGPFLDAIDEVGNSPGESFYGPIALWCECGKWNIEGAVEIRELLTPKAG